MIETIALILAGVVMIMAFIDGFRELNNKHKEKQNKRKNNQCRKRV